MRQQQQHSSSAKLLINEEPDAEQSFVLVPKHATYGNYDRPTDMKPSILAEMRKSDKNSTRTAYFHAFLEGKSFLGILTLPHCYVHQWYVLLLYED